MKSFGGKAAKFIRKTIDPEGAERNAMVNRADAARDAGDWLIAAGLYQSAAKSAPHRSDLFVQAGNCLKEARRFNDAFEAYCKALSLGPNADCEVQLGHLLKISGNFSAAARAYRRGAALGDEWGSEEVRNLPSITSDVVKFPPTDAANSRTELLPRKIFDAIFDCDVNDYPEPRVLRRTASILISIGEIDAAKAFIQLAYLISWPTSKIDDHISAVLRSGLWPVDHLAKLAITQGTRSEAQSLGPRGRLHALLSAATFDEHVDNGASFCDDPITRNLQSWPPAVLKAAEGERRLLTLIGAIGKAYEIVTSSTLDSRSDFIDSVRALAAELQSNFGAIAFPDHHTRDSLRLCELRILSDCAGKWLGRVKSRYLGPAASNHVLAAVARLGGNPILERINEGVSQASVFHEINAMSLVEMAEDLGSKRDLALSRVFAVCLPDINVDDALIFFQEATRSELQLTAATLIARHSWAPFSGELAAVAFAQQLKAIGMHDTALRILEENITEEAASVPALIEKALLAKIVGNFTLSARLLEACIEREPKNEFLRIELAAVLPEIEPIDEIIKRLRSDSLFIATARRRLNFRLAMDDQGEEGLEIKLSEDISISDLAPELSPELSRETDETSQDSEEIRIIEMGWRHRQSVGRSLRQLGDIDFVRTHVFSKKRIERMRLRIDGKTIAFADGVKNQTSGKNPMLFHYIFNCWFDLTGITRGQHEIQLYFEERDGGYRSYEEAVWVEPLGYSPDHETCLSAVRLPENTLGLPLEERIAKLPSVILSAERKLLQSPVSRILVIRADQLGDACQSMGAILALKEAFPSATFECLTSPGNHDLIQSTNLFNEVHCVTLTYDSAKRRRYATLAEQVRLRKLLVPKKFDLAVDLSPGFTTQHLLRIANARYTAGFKPNEFRWLTYGADIQTHDLVNRREVMPHAAMISSFVASLVSMVKHEPTVLRREAIDWNLLSEFNLKPGDNYAVLHAGARLEAKRWPLEKFLSLAKLITTHLGIKTVLLTDDPSELNGIDVSGHPEGLLITTSQKPSFEKFDTLLSVCKVFVGNDSGPKHLAALRGAPVVSIQNGQVNWNEWGQEGTGLIVARKAPCVGCGIETFDECGKGVVCLFDITPQEVFEAVIRQVKL